MKNYFKITDFIIDQSYKVPLKVIDDIYRFHLFQINKVRNIINKPIIVSKNSCYRPHQYEIDKGRSGNSQHTFRDITNGKRGAADYTCEDLEALLNGLIKHSKYMRICVYPKNNFIHCDYASNQRQLFYDYGNGWEFIRNLKN